MLYLKFLKEIYSIRQDKKADHETDGLFAELLAILRKHYSRPEIQWAISNAEMASRYSRPNRFAFFCRSISLLLLLSPL
ncbi:MAG: hypothetical protein ACHQD7_01250 [Chitinophagales bacterium]